MKVFANKDCTHTAVFGHYLNYEAAPGQWEEVDLNFERQGPDYVMDQHALIVRVRGSAVEVVDRKSGQGLRWLTPGPPVVAGRAAAFRHRGLDWQYATRKSGIKLEAVVESQLGPRTYDFNYALLGGATELVEDPRGNLLSGGFAIPRAVAFGSDGKTYVAGKWRLLSGHRAAFHFDDSGLPPPAFPYVLDPTTVFDLGGPDTRTFGGGDSGDDGTVEGWSSVYPPALANDSDTLEAFLAIRRTNHGSLYEVRNGLIRWDTSTLPDTARVLSARLEVSPTLDDGYEAAVGCPLQNEDQRYLTADWYSAWPIDGTDYSSSAQSSALAGVYLGAFDPDVGQAVERVKVPLDNTDGVSTTGYSGLRFHISGGQPNGRNSVCFAAFDNATFPEPQLTVTYSPVPPYVLGVENDSARYPGQYQWFKVHHTDLVPGDTERAVICKTPFLNRLNGTCESGQGYTTGPWSSVSPAEAEYLTKWNEVGENIYYAFACNAYNVCSPNYAQGSFRVLNMPPAPGPISDSPDPVNADQTITFTVPFIDTLGDQVRAVICKTDAVLASSCPGGAWAIGAFATNAIVPGGTAYNARGVATATYVPTSADAGTQTYYAFACDTYNACAGPYYAPWNPQQFTVTGSQGPGGGDPCTTYHVFWSDKDSGAFRSNAEGSSSEIRFHARDISAECPQAKTNWSTAHIILGAQRGNWVEVGWRIHGGTYEWFVEWAEDYATRVLTSGPYPCPREEGTFHEWKIVRAADPGVWNARVGCTPDGTTVLLYQLGPSIFGQGIPTGETGRRGQGSGGADWHRDLEWKGAQGSWNPWNNPVCREDDDPIWRGEKQSSTEYKVQQGSGNCFDGVPY